MPTPKSDILLRRFGLAVKRAREKSGMTVRAFADYLEVTVSGLQEIEKGARAPSLYLACSIAGRIDLSLDELARLGPRGGRPR